MAKNDQKKTQEISKSIPELDESDKEIATCEESKNWAKNTTKFYCNGYVLPTKNGIGLQVIDEKIVRCISVVRDENTLRLLSMLRLTFESAGIELQIDPFAVVQNITQQPEGTPPYLSEATDNIAANPETDEFTEATPENRLYNEGMEVV